MMLGNDFMHRLTNAADVKLRLLKPAPDNMSSTFKKTMCVLLQWKLDCTITVYYHIITFPLIT